MARSRTLARRAIQLPVMGAGGAPAISVSPSSWDFGSTPVGTPVTKEFTIENTGTAALEITLPITTPAGYTVTVDPATSIAPGASTTFTVQADADSLGIDSGNISIVSNAETSPTLVAITVNIHLEFLLHDDFAVADAAPMEASSDVTGGKRKKAADTNNNGSVSGGAMLLTGASSVNFVNPGYYWTDESDAGFPVVDGLCVGFGRAEAVAANTNQGMSCGCHADITPAGNQAYHWYHSSGAGTGGLSAVVASIIAVGSWINNQRYRLVQAFNNGRILFYRFDGTNWTLERNTTTTFPSVVYPTVTGVATSTGWTFDDVTVSQAADPSIFDTGMAEDTVLNPATHAALISFLNDAVFF